MRCKDSDFLSQRKTYKNRWFFYLFLLSLHLEIKQRYTFLYSKGHFNSDLFFLTIHITYHTMKRVTFYVDGFNFYYALRRSKKVDWDWQKCYWLNFVQFFEKFLGPNQVLEKVVYFTASPLNPEKSKRQGILFNANRVLNPGKFEIIRGRYIQKPYVCPSCGYTYYKPEEKRTDVNLSVQMMGDCALNKTDVLVLVSADSDLAPPIEFIQKNYPDKNVRVYFPPNAFSNDLNSYMISRQNKVIKLANNKNKFLSSLLPDSITTTDGKNTYTRPKEWE